MMAVVDSMMIYILGIVFVIHFVFAMHNMIADRRIKRDEIELKRNDLRQRDRHHLEDHELRKDIYISDREFKIQQGRLGYLTLDQRDRQFQDQITLGLEGLIQRDRQHDDKMGFEREKLERHSAQTKISNEFTERSVRLSELKAELQSKANSKDERLNGAQGRSEPSVF